MSFFTLGAWGALYAYTPEAYPTNLRGTGMGAASGMTRISGALAPSLGAALIWAVWAVWFAAKGILPDFWEAAFAHNFAVANIPLNQRLQGVVDHHLHLPPHFEEFFTDGVQFRVVLFAEMFSFHIYPVKGER